MNLRQVVTELCDLTDYAMTLTFDVQTGYEFNVWMRGHNINIHGNTLIGAIYNLFRRLEGGETKILIDDLREQISELIKKNNLLKKNNYILAYSGQSLPDDILTLFKNGTKEYFGNPSIQGFLKHFNFPKWMIVRDYGRHLVLTNGTIHLHVRYVDDKYFVEEVQ